MTETGNAVPLRALIVDDEAAIRRLLAASLTHEGFICDLAADGERAARLLSETRYDIVVTDLLMPHHHGHALVVDIMDMPNRPAVVVLTGVVSPPLLKDLIVRGVDSVVNKPVEFMNFAKKLRRIAERHMMQTALADFGPHYTPQFPANDQQVAH